MKNITAVGYLTKDCEVVENEKNSFVKFSIAVDDGYGENKGTMFFGARYFRTKISPYLLKGKLVAITGDLKKNEYEGKTYLSINATDVKLLGGKNTGTMNVSEAAAKVSEKEKSRYAEGEKIEVDYSRDAVKAQDFDDEIPF